MIDNTTIKNWAAAAGLTGIFLWAVGIGSKRTATKRHTYKKRQYHKRKPAAKHKSKKPCRLNDCSLNDKGDSLIKKKYAKDI